MWRLSARPPASLAIGAFSRGEGPAAIPVWKPILRERRSRPVEIADNVITSRGMGTAMDFALAIVEVLCGKEKAQEMAEAVVHQR